VRRYNLDAERLAPPPPPPPQAKRQRTQMFQFGQG